MTKEQVIAGLRAGRKLRCDRKDEPLLPWLLSHPDIENGGIVQHSDQYSYIEFWWKPAPSALVCPPGVDPEAWANNPANHYTPEHKSDCVVNVGWPCDCGVANGR